MGFMGSLTALLVLASMMPVFTGDLPKASYTKLIDMWLLFFIISTTINICIHIIVDWLRKEELEKKRESENTQVRPMTVKEIHNGQKIYPLKKKMRGGEGRGWWTPRWSTRASSSPFPSPSSSSLATWLSRSSRLLLA